MKPQLATVFRGSFGPASPNRHPCGRVHLGKLRIKLRIRAYTSYDQRFEHQVVTKVCRENTNPVQLPTHISLVATLTAKMAEKDTHLRQRELGLEKL